VFKVGADWGERKSIVNKLAVSSSVTTMVWPKEKIDELYFGLAEGKIKGATLKNNRSTTLYNTDSYVVSMAASFDSTIIVSGHYDGSIYIYNLETQNYKKALTYRGIPYAVGAGKNIVVAGNDQKVSFYDLQGNFKIRHDYSTDDKCRDFTAASVNPNGVNIVLGNYNRFYMFN